MKVYLIALFVCLLPEAAWAQGAPAADEVTRLREQIAAQQKQLDEQRKQLEAQQKALDAQQQALDRLLAAPAKAEPAAAAKAPAAAPAAQAAAAPQVDTNGKPFSPLSFRIGGAEFTPGGFLDTSLAFRSTNVGTGVATQFNSIPFNNTQAGELTETRFSAQNSRVTLKVTDNPTKNLGVTGYLEVDFAGYLPANAYVVSNSYSLRMRQAWTALRKGNWELLAGQGWTLLTPNRVGTSTIPAELFIGLEQDANYLVGLTWGRQGQVRFTYHFTPSWTLAVSAENPEQYVTSATVLPSFVTSQIDNTSGLSSTPNVRPDLIAKLAYDTKVGGKSLHFELAGLSRQFKTVTTTGVTHGAQGAGGSFGSVLEAFKNFRVILTTFYSGGGGRYITGYGPDFIVGPDGSISPVHSMAGIAGIEYSPAPKSTIFSYYGGDYFWPNYVRTGASSYLGFGFPGSSSSANRQIQEATLGYAHTFFRNPNYGAFQTYTQYSYVTRAPLYVAPLSPASAHTHMVFVGLRYTLP